MVLGIGLLGLLLAGPLFAQSAFIGGLVCWIPTCWFAVRAFRHSGARSSIDIVRSFYAGAAGKMVLTIVMFGFVFALVKPISAPAVFLGFAATQVMSWLIPLVVAQLEHKRKRVQN